MGNQIEEKIDNIRITMAENFGVTKTELKNITEHLNILNGRVGAVEVKVTDIVIKATTQSTRLDNISTWRGWLLPVLTGLLSAMTVYIITKN